MIRMHALTPNGQPHHSGRTPLATGTICAYCFEVLGVPNTKAQSNALEARHICAEKLVARQPAAPVPFN
jgi:hypothetical protein